MSEFRTHKDGSITLGPIDKFTWLVEDLEAFAEATKDHEPPATQLDALRKLAWFLGERGEAEATEAIMKHAAHREPGIWMPHWGYHPGI